MLEQSKREGVIIQGASVGYEFKLRWQHGPQFGEREVMSSFVERGGERVYTEEKYSPWVWRNWRLKVVEGEEKSISFVFQDRNGQITTGFDFTDKAV